MSRWGLRRSVLLATLGVVSLGFAGAAVGCTGSGGVRMFNEAPLAEGWPELTPVGEVQVKEYPQTRAAVVRDDVPEVDAEGEQAESDAAGDQPVKSRAERRREMDGAFMKLFNHIKKNDIAMTSPVDMGYAEIEADEVDADAVPEQVSMAFLYRRTDQGEAGEDGEVLVQDLPARTYVSIGVRGGYTDERFVKNLAALDAWLEENTDVWQPDGPPRYLGYNSPFVPPFMRYGEVQRPVRPVGVEVEGEALPSTE